MAKHKNVIELGSEKTLQNVNPRVRLRRILFSSFIAIAILLTIYLTSPMSRLGVVYFDGLITLTRADLIDLIDIESDEFFLTIRLGDIRNQIDNHPVVNNVTVARAGINRLRITIVEYEVGACAIVTGEVFHILTDGTLLYEDDGMRTNCAGMMIHGLTEIEVEAGIASLFVRQLMRVDPQIRDLIQSIHHEPKYGDVYRFSIAMIDGNDVKVTSHTMHDYLNLYPTLIEAAIRSGHLEVGQTGIFNLDVGGFFQPHD